MPVADFLGLTATTLRAEVERPDTLQSWRARTFKTDMTHDDQGPGGRKRMNRRWRHQNGKPASATTRASVGFAGR